MSGLPSLSLTQLRDLFQKPYEDLPKLFQRKVSDTDLKLINVQKNPRQAIFRLERTLRTTKVKKIVKNYGYSRHRYQDGYVAYRRGDSFLHIYLLNGTTDFHTFDPVAAELAYHIVAGIKQI